MEGVEAEMARLTVQWPNAVSRVDVDGINKLHERYGTVLDAQVALGADLRDVTKVTITRSSEDYDSGASWHLLVSLCKHSSDTSWVYVSGPVQATCDSLASRLQDYILQTVKYPAAATGVGRYQGIEARLQHIHPAIKSNVIPRIVNGHGDDALEEACKSVGERLRNMSGVQEDGVALVGEALGKKRRIALNDGVSKTDVSEEEGYMHLALALFKAARNPRAHRPADPNFDLDELVEWLHVVSAMHRALDRAKPNP